MPKNSKHPHKRRVINFLISPKFQLGLIVINLGIFSIALLGMAYHANQSWKVFRSLIFRFRLQNEPLFMEAMALEEKKFSTAIFLYLGLCFIFCAIATVIFSHRLAGPLYKLKIFFKDICANGFTHELVFRKKDFSQELPAIVNEALKKVRSSKS